MSLDDFGQKLARVYFDSFGDFLNLTETLSRSPVIGPTLTTSKIFTYSPLFPRDPI